MVSHEPTVIYNRVPEYKSAPKSILKVNSGVQSLDPPPRVKSSVLTPTMKREIDRIAPIVIKKSDSSSSSSSSSSSCSLEKNPYASGDIQIKI